MSKIRVPAVPKAAYNPNRAVSSLLKTQIAQLQTAILQAVDTEGEAADCIGTLQQLLERLRPHIIPVAYSDAAGKKLRATTKKKTRPPRKRRSPSRKKVARR